VDKNKNRTLMMRAMLNTAFMFDDFIRLYKRDLEFSDDIILSDHFFIDICIKKVDDIADLNDNPI
jgi:hypothetical protein